MLFTCLCSRSTYICVRHRKSDLIVHYSVEKYRFGKPNYKTHSHLDEMRSNKKNTVKYISEELSQCQLKRKRMWSVQVCLIIVIHIGRKNCLDFAGTNVFACSYCQSVCTHTWSLIHIRFILLSISHIEFDQLILAFREFNWINTDFCSCLHCCCCFRSISLLLRQKKKLILYKQKWQLKQYYWIWQLTRAASVIRLAKKMWWHYWSKVYWNFFHSWNSSSKPPPPTVICTCSRKMAQFFCICGSSTMASLPSTLNFSKANLNHRSSHLM